MDENMRQEIERVAHQLWEQEGRVEGRDQEHWRAAEAIVAERLSAKAEEQRKVQGHQQAKPEDTQQIAELLGRLLIITTSVFGIVEKTLAAITAKPELLQDILRPVGGVVASIDQTLQKTVPELGKALGTTVGGTVSEVGKTLGQTVGGLGQALGATGQQEAAPEAGKGKEEMVRSLRQKLSDEELMNKSVEELSALSRALESRKTA